LKIAKAVQKNKSAPDSLKSGSEVLDEDRLLSGLNRTKAKNRDSGLTLAEKLINQAEARQDLCGTARHFLPARLGRAPPVAVGPSAI
jgi:hypothetical protein